CTGPLPTRRYAFSLHDALPIFGYFDIRVGRSFMVDNTHHTTRIKTVGRPFMATSSNRQYTFPTRVGRGFSPTSALKTPQCIDITDRKSTRLNSSHVKISYAVFC